MTSFADTLRQIADRLDAASAMRNTALEELASIAGDGVMVLDFFSGVEHEADSAAGLVPAGAGAEDGGGTSTVPSAPIHAGARKGREVRGHGARRGRRKPIAPHAAVDEDVAGAAGGRGKSAVSLDVDAVGTKAPGQGIVDRESAPTAEGSTRVHCPDCDWIGKPGGLGVHRRHRHGYKAGQVAGDSHGPINCPDCGESIAQKKNLARHRKVAHGWEPWQPTPVVPTNGAPVIRRGAEWFVCSRCPLKFPTRETRDAHQATHPPIPDVGPLRSIGRGGGLGE